MGSSYFWELLISCVSSGTHACIVNLRYHGLGLTLPETNMETHIVTFRGTVVFTGPFLGFHVSFRECIRFKIRLQISKDQGFGFMA